MNGFYTQIADGKIYAEWIKTSASDDRPVIVFLHDALGCVTKWRDFPKMMCEKLQMNGVVYDRIGHGNSSAGNKGRPLNYLEHEGREVLPAFLKANQVDRPILYGHSDGGSIALIYAALHEPALIITEAAHVLVEEVTIEGIKRASKDQLLEERLTKYHGEKTRTLINNWVDTWLSEDYRAWNIQPMLARIKCPVLTLQGEKDEYASLEHLNYISSSIGAHARSMAIIDAGHELHRNHGSVVLSETAKFMAEVMN